LQRDIANKISAIELERIHKEQYEALDNAEIEARAEKAISLLDPSEIANEELKQN
jgi:hypothetical protein